MIVLRPALSIREIPRAFLRRRTRLPSICDRIMPALPTEPELLSYLRQGRIIMIGTGDVPFDQILGGRMESAEAEGFDAGTLIDHGCILTDGTWFWFGSYIHYVKTHHIRLCEEFIAYAKGQNWTIDGGLIPIHNIDYRMLEKSAFA